MLEADFDYFMGRVNSITKDQPIEYTHTRNAKLCKCGKLDIFFRFEKGIILQAAFGGSISIPTQVMVNDVCFMVQGKKPVDAIKMNFAGGLGYKPDIVYQKCFHNFIVRTLALLLKEIIDESSLDSTTTSS